MIYLNCKQNQKGESHWRLRGCMVIDPHYLILIMQAQGIIAKIILQQYFQALPKIL